MTSEADMEDKLRQLAAVSATHQAQLIGLAAVIARLPGISRIDRALVDAAIEDQCRQRGLEDRDTARTFAHSILQAASETNMSHPRIPPAKTLPRYLPQKIRAAKVAVWQR